MTSNLIRQWQNDTKVLNPKPGWRSYTKINHAAHHRQQREIHPLEIPHDAVNAHAETGLLQLLGRRGPGDVDAEEVAA